MIGDYLNFNFFRFRKQGSDGHRHGDFGVKVTREVKGIFRNGPPWIFLVVVA